MGMANAYGGFTNGKATQAAGTVINSLAQPRKGGFTRVTTLRYNNGGTGHTGTWLRPLGRTKTSAVGAAGQAVVNIVVDPGITTGFSNNGVPIVNTNGIAAGHTVVIRETDGIARAYIVSSVATLAITLTTNLVAGVNTTSDFWFMGLITDTDKRTGTAHIVANLPASVITTYADDTAGVCSTIGQDEPILFQSNNITAAGTVEQLSGAYTQV